jgi:hypothetical protein
VKILKFAVLAWGLLGLVACFLPLASMPGLTVTFWDTHKGPEGAQTYFVMAGYVIAAVMGGVGVAKGLTRPVALASAVGFGLVLIKFRGIFSELWRSAIGGKLLLVAAIGGLVISIVAAALAKDEATS